jgi:thiamine-monophosphate kinase
MVLAVPLPELQLISRIRRWSQRKPLARSRGRIAAGIGDDCALLGIPANHDTLVTTDLSLEGVHFRREWHPPESVGHRCLARGLSDIAAMGGEPLAAFLSLGLPAKLRQPWVDAFFRGLLHLAEQFGVTLAGGDISESRAGVLADVVMVGFVPRGKAVRRSGARPGDRIYVTGELGGSAATLERLSTSGKKRLNPGFFPRHYFPQPRIHVAKILREKKIATAMIDLSDGLSTDLGHICQESRTGAEIWEEKIPRASVGKPPEKVNIEFARDGGEDYELLFTARPGTRVPKTIANIAITEIGIIPDSARRILLHSQSATRELVARGWEHFRQPSLNK